MLSITIVLHESHIICIPSCCCSRCAHMARALQRATQQYMKWNGFSLYERTYKQEEWSYMARQRIVCRAISRARIKYYIDKFNIGNNIKFIIISVVCHVYVEDVDMYIAHIAVTYKTVVSQISNGYNN